MIYRLAVKINDDREEPDQDQNGDLDEYLNHFPNYNPDDSYIDDEEFGSGINDNANRTVVVDKDTMPGKFTAAKKEKKPAEAVDHRHEMALVGLVSDDVQVPVPEVEGIIPRPSRLR